MLCRYVHNFVKNDCFALIINLNKLSSVPIPKSSPLLYVFYNFLKTLTSKVIFGSEFPNTEQRQKKMPLHCLGCSIFLEKSCKKLKVLQLYQFQCFPCPLDHLSTLVPPHYYLLQWSEVLEYSNL